METLKVDPRSKLLQATRILGLRLRTPLEALLVAILRVFLLCEATYSVLLRTEVLWLRHVLCSPLASLRITTDGDTRVVVITLCLMFRVM
jgi:hypothetical protein